MRKALGTATDENAQLHVLEAVIAALLFFGAIQVGVSLSPDAQSTTALDTLEITGRDALRSQYLLTPDSLNETESASYGDSALVYYLLTGSTGNITSFLNTTLDTSISYTLSLEKYPGNETVVLFEMSRTVDESVSTHYSFHHAGTLYDVRLILWREPRGVVT
jgi:hypothetical protein